MYSEVDEDEDEEAIADHERMLRALIDRCQKRELVLNKDKLRLRQKEVRFIGHLVTSEGSVKAVEDVAGGRRFLGFLNYLSKFLPSLSDLCEPLRKLTLKVAVLPRSNN